jgi:glycosyltransferase involved in cell wall biosynthesis
VLRSFVDLICDKVGERESLKVVWLSDRELGSPNAGGAERLAYEVLSRLASKGVEIQQLTIADSSSSTSETVDGIHFTRFRSQFSERVNVGLFLKEHGDADVVVEDLGHAVPWFTSYFSSIPTIALFYHLHARTLAGQVPWPGQIVVGMLERSYPQIYRRADFVAISENSRHDLLGLGVPGSRITIIHPGVDSDLFHPAAPTVDPQIVYFGGLREYKRADHAIEAFKILLESEHQAKMVVVGSGPSLAHVESRAKSLGVADRVFFTGRVDASRLAEIVNQSWVNIHCSVAEGWCLSAMEAAAAGIPTAAYAVPGVIESVRQGETGMLVPSGEIRALGGSLAYLVRRRDLFSQTCRAWALHFTWDDCAGQWFDLLSRESRI